MAKKQASDEADDGRASQYDALAFFLKLPCSDDVHKGPFRVRDRDGYRRLLERAKEQRLYLWYAKVVKVDRVGHRAVHPHLIDFDSVPDQPYPYDRAETPRAPAPPRYPEDLTCAVCGHKCSSTSGYTLHMKAHRQAEADAEDGDPLRCPHCRKKCNSSSGLTLHVKHQHPGEVESHG